MPNDEEIAKLKDERIQLLTMLNRWRLNGHHNIYALAVNLDYFVGERIKEVQNEQP